MSGLFIIMMIMTMMITAYAAKKLTFYARPTATATGILWLRVWYGYGYRHGTAMAMGESIVNTGICKHQIYLPCALLLPSNERFPCNSSSDGDKRILCFKYSEATFSDAPKGCLYLLDWTTELDHWTGLLDKHNFMQKCVYDVIIVSPPSCFAKRSVLTDHFSL